jgi:hypothetical protein
MSITQRYWKVRTPWLILTGVLFGPFGVSALHIPSYLAYYGHRKGWGGRKFALYTTGVALILLSLAMSAYDKRS